MSAKGNKKKLRMGMGMVAVFLVVLALIFMPIFNGHNGLDYLDNLYNSISKASAYYIPQLSKEAQTFEGKPLDLAIKMANKDEAQRVQTLLAAAGLTFQAEGLDGTELKLQGDLGALLKSCLTDSESMFHNDGKAVSERYQGADARLMLFTWWSTLKALDKSLNRVKAFAQAKFVQTVQAKAVEMTYNYFGIEPQAIGDRWFIVLISLLFYVCYTLWYGFGVMYLFEGTGYQLEH